MYGGSNYLHRPLGIGPGWAGWVVHPQPDDAVLGFPGGAPGGSGYAFRAKLASATQYGYQSRPQIPDAAVAFATALPVWPHTLKLPRRLPDYTVIVQPEIADRDQPPGIQRWPHAAMPARRLSDYTVVVQVQPSFQVFPATGTPEWPDLAPAARRLRDYTVVVQVQPFLPTTALPEWPDLAPTARRLRDYTVVVQVQPTLPVILATAAPVWPTRSPGPARRTSLTLLETIWVHPLPLAAPVGSLAFPQRAPGAALSARSAYNAINLGTGLACIPLGQFPPGQTVIITYQVPDVPPIAVIVGNAGVIETETMLSRQGLTYSYQLFLSPKYPPGNYRVTVTTICGDDLAYCFTVTA